MWERLCAPTSVYGIQPPPLACVLRWHRHDGLRDFLRLGERRSAAQIRRRNADKHEVRIAPAPGQGCCLVSKKRSITIALRSAAVRPKAVPPFASATADPVSTATKVPSDK